MTRIRERRFSGWAKVGNRAGFTILELMTVVAIIGILAGMAVPSIVAWREGELVNGARRSLISFVRGLPTESRRLGATCKNRIVSGTNMQDWNAFTIECIARGSESERIRCSGGACNISSYGMLQTPVDRRLYIASNASEVAYTPRGFVSGNVDIVYIVGLKASARRVGAIIQPPRCLRIRAVTGIIKTGSYRGATGSSDTRSASIQSLDPSLCQ